MSISNKIVGWGLCFILLTAGALRAQKADESAPVKRKISQHCRTAKPQLNDQTLF